MPAMTGRPECTSAVRALGERLAQAGPETLVHGDASMRNMRTSSKGEIALLDWEDVGTGPGVGDLAWLLVSSVEPSDWSETILAYGDSEGLYDALPAATAQAFFALTDAPVHSEAAAAWVQRIEEASQRLT